MLTGTRPTPSERCPPSTWSVGVFTGVMAVLCALTLAGTIDQHGGDAGTVALHVAVAVAGVALVPAFFRRPVGAAVVLAVLAALSATATPPATAAVYVVARSRPLPTAVGVAVLGATGHVVRGLFQPQPGLSRGWLVVLVLVAHAGLVAAGAFAQARAALLAGLEERARRAEADRDRDVAEAVAAERTRIAREMHDVLAHRLSLLATYAGALEYRPDAPPERLTEAAGVVRAGVHQALEEVRDVVGVLREDPDSGTVPVPSPGVDRLPDLVREARAAGATVDLALDVDGEPPGLVGRTAYRLVQEALTNVRKHAPAQPAQVRVSGRPGTGVEVSVTNPLGPVRAPLPSSGTGLVGLAERVRIVGGRLEHGDDGDRFRLSAWLPWPP